MLVLVAGQFTSMEADQVFNDQPGLARIHRREVARWVRQGMRGNGKRREGLIPIDVAVCRVR